MARPNWIIEIMSADGPRYYGPFKDAAPAVEWVRMIEDEAGFPKSWKLLSLVAPGRR